MSGPGAREGGAFEAEIARLPADREHVIALAIHLAADGDPSLLNRLVAEIRAMKVYEHDRRIPGLEHAEGIADHWHQRFLLLKGEAGGGARQLRLGFNADGAKQVLDDIRAERQRLAAPRPDREGARHG